MEHWFGAEELYGEASEGSPIRRTECNFAAGSFAVDDGQGGGGLRPSYDGEGPVEVEPGDPCSVAPASGEVPVAAS